MRKKRRQQLQSMIEKFGLNEDVDELMKTSIYAAKRNLITLH